MPSPRSRPAETTGGIGAVATAIVALAGASPEVVGIVGTLAGLLPAVVTLLVTLLVTHGGIRGVARAIWGGRPA